MIQLNQLTKAYTQDIILDEITMSIHDGDHIAIVGENGCGKSTLLKVIAGMEAYQEGECLLSKQTKIAYLDQHFDDYTGSVENYLMQAYKDIHEIQQKMLLIEQKLTNADEVLMEQLLTKYGNLQEQFEKLEGYQITTFVEQIARGLNFESLCSQDYTTLSGGEKARVNLALRLLEKADVLLLDEPTNHLDYKGIAWLEQFIANTKHTVVLISHDRTFLNHTVSKIYELSYGELHCYHGNYDYYKEERIKQYEQMLHNYEEQQKQIKKMKTMIQQYRQWAQIGDNESFYKKAKMLEKRLAHMQCMRKPSLTKRAMNIQIKQAPRSSKEAIVAKQLSLGYEHQTILIEQDFTICWQNRIAICGENGSGKSTLLKTLLGIQEPLSGTISYGNQISIGYLPQIIEFKEHTQLLAYAIYTLSISEEDTRRYLFRFGFDQIDMMKHLHLLSGGEKTRLMLAILLHKECNFIILDEPTNHLDFSSIDFIERNLKEYTGTLLVVSHDRYFIHSLCDQIWMLEDASLHVQLL